MTHPRALAVALLLALTLPARVAMQTADTPELVLMKGHASNVLRMTFSRDGQFLLSSSSDAPGIVWRVAEARPSRVIPSADVATTFSDGDGGLWVSDATRIRHLAPGSTAERVQERAEETPASLCRTVTSPTGEWELQVSCDGERRTFTSTDGSQTWPVTYALSTREGFWAGNSFVAIADDTHTLLTFDPLGRAVSASTRVDVSARIRGVVGPPAAPLILIEEFLGRPSHRLRVYDVRTHARRAEYALSPQERVALDPTGTFILRLSGTVDAPKYAIHQTKDDTLVAKGGVERDLIDSVALSPNGRTFAIAHLSGDVTFVDVETNAVRRPRVLHPTSVTGLALSEHHDSLLAIGYGAVHLWDLDRGYPAGLVSNAAEGTIAVSQHGALGFVRDQKVHLAVGEREVTFDAKRTVEAVLAVSNDGKYAVWREDTGGLRNELLLSDGSVLCRDAMIGHPVFSPDSRLLAFDCPMNVLRIYDLEQHQLLPGRARVSGNVTVAFDTGSKHLVSAEGSRVCVRQARTLESGPCFDADGEVTSLAYLHADDFEEVAVATRRNFVDLTVLVTENTPTDPLPVRMAHLPLPWSNARHLLLTGTGELITAGEDGAVRFWSVRPDDVRLMATLMASGIGDFASFNRAQTGVKDWVVVSPDGFFDAGGRGIDWILWRSGDAIYPGDLLFSDFYTPGLLGMVLQHRAPSPRSGMDLTTFLKTPGLRALVAQRSARLIRSERDTTLCLADSPANFGLWVDGTVEVVPSFEHDVAGPPDCQYRHTWPTVVRLEALNTYGLTQPTNRPTPWDRQKAPLKSGSKLHIVTVAGGDYDLQKTGFAPLPGAVENVKAIRTFFVDQQKQSPLAFPQIEVWDPVPLQTRQETLSRLEKILRQVSADDILFLYLSGHGKSPWGQTLFFLVPEQGRGDSLDDLRETAISSVDLAEYLRTARAKRILIVVDTCQSAASFETLSKFGEAEIQLEEFAALAATQVGLGNPREGMGFYLLASASPLQTAQLSASGPSRLVQRLLNVWKGDANQRAATARGLMNAFRTDLVDWPGEQRPVTTALGMDFDLPSAHRARQMQQDSKVAAVGERGAVAIVPGRRPAVGHQRLASRRRRDTGGTLNQAEGLPKRRLGRQEIQRRGPLLRASGRARSHQSRVSPPPGGCLAPVRQDRPRRRGGPESPGSAALALAWPLLSTVFRVVLPVGIVREATSVRPLPSSV